MNYNYNNENFKFVKKNGKIKVYHYSSTRWSRGLTYIGEYTDENQAIVAAKKYSR